MEKSGALIYLSWSLVNQATVGHAHRGGEIETGPEVQDDVVVVGREEAVEMVKVLERPLIQTLENLADDRIAVELFRFLFHPPHPPILKLKRKQK